MEYETHHLARLSALIFACGLAACGGGGGSQTITQEAQSSAAAPAPAPAPSPDARNGDYTLYASNARQYALTLDFDASAYRIVGNGLDETGAITAIGASFALTPPGASPPVNNARFNVVDTAVVGAFRFGGVVTPFIASRTFVATIAEAAGEYKFLSTTVDPAAPSNNIIQTGEIVAPNTIRVCNDAVVATMAACPAASVATGTVSVTGADFRADFGTSGGYPFRVARIDGERVFLRASTSTGTSRRFLVGIDVNTGYADVTFAGINSEGQSTITRIDGTSLTSTLRSEADVQTTRTGNRIGAGAVPGLASIGTVADGFFFSMRTASLAFLFAARDNPTHPGYVEVGKP